MDASQFRNKLGSLKKGRLNDHDYTYFVPAPIPRKINYDDDLAYALSQADSSLGQLSGLGRNLPNPNLLITPYLRREAVLSSKIEGTQASLSDVFIEEAGADAPTKSNDTAEVVAYVRALNKGIAKLESGHPLNLDLLRELHAILLAGVRGKDKNPGNFRTEQNWIGPEGQGVSLARYVPPAPGEMQDLLADFQRYLDDHPRMPSLVQSALLHYQFEAIHPFVDGNGRIGRLMIILHLLERGSLSKPLLYLSAYFEQRRHSYYDHLLHVSETGEYTQWLEFFLEGVHIQSEDALRRGQALVSLREEYQSTLQSLGATASTFQLLDRLFQNPYITIPYAQSFLGVSFPTAQRAIEYLESADILRETTGQQRNKRFRAETILQTIELDTPPPAGEKRA